MKTILVVDDDAVLVDALRAVLEGEFAVFTASTGEEAVARISERTPDLIILDVMMTYPSEGYDLANLLKKTSSTSSIPIIMLTGVDKITDLRAQLEKTWVQCDRFLTKPPDLGELLATVHELVAVAQT